MITARKIGDRTRNHRGRLLPTELTESCSINDAATDQRVRGLDIHTSRGGCHMNDGSKPMMRVCLTIGRTLCVASLLLIAACGTGSPPYLPPTGDPHAVAETVTGPDGRAFLNDIVAYPWADGGRDAGARFGWIEEDAMSANQGDAVRAADTAHALAAFVSENRTVISAGPPNHSLLESFARSLVPFIAALAGDPMATPAFRPLDSTEGSMPRTADVFATMTEHESAKDTFIRAASGGAADAEDAFARGVASNPSTVASEPLGRLLLAARLRGLLVAGAALNDLNAPEPPLLAARTRVAYTLAATMVSRDDPSIDRAFFGPTGKLVEPELIPSAGWSQYDAQLRQYLAAYPAITDALQQFEAAFLRIAVR